MWLSCTPVFVLRNGWENATEKLDFYHRENGTFWLKLAKILIYPLS
jgi:hypothetical protein